MKIKFHTYPDGTTYEGEILAGKRHGFGLLIRPDGVKYKGEWYNDKPHGEGMLFYPDGRRIEGIWSEGKRLKEEKQKPEIKKQVTIEDHLNKEIKKAIESLKREGENIDYDLATNRNEGFVVTDQRVIFFKAISVSENASSSSFYYEDINDVYFRKGGSGGHILLVVDGKPELRGADTVDTINTENALSFLGEYAITMEKKAALIRERANKHGGIEKMKVSDFAKNIKEEMVGVLPGKLERAYYDNITKSEIIDVKLNTQAGQAIVVTDKRVMLLKAGNVSSAGFFGASCKSFNYNQITSVDIRLSLMGGHIQITVAGSTDIADKRLLDMAQAENAIVFTSDYKERMKKIVMLIRERIGDSSTKVEILGEMPSKNITSQIKELAELHKEGILNDEEFKAAKNKLLQ